MITRAILSADHDFISGGPGGRWCVLFNHEVHGTYAYVFPVSALWYRSAEYGIDLKDADTLLDVVLNDMAMISVGQGLTETEPDFVYHVHSSVAWQGHQRRIAQFKTTLTHDDSQGVLKKVTDHHRANLNNPALKALHANHSELISSIRNQRGVV